MSRDTIAKTVEFVRLGYNDVSLDFKVDVSDFDEFSQCVQAIGQYNEFEPTRVIEALTSIFPEVNNVVVGREHSVCLYIHLPYWESHKVKHRGVKVENDNMITKQELDRLGSEIMVCFKQAKADEINYVDSTDGGGIYDKREGRTLIRAWWD